MASEEGALDDERTRRRPGCWSAVAAAVAQCWEEMVYVGPLGGCQVDAKEVQQEATWPQPRSTSARGVGAQGVPETAPSMRTLKEMAAAGQRRAQLVHQSSQTWDQPGSAPTSNSPPTQGPEESTLVPANSLIRSKSKIPRKNYDGLLSLLFQ